MHFGGLGLELVEEEPGACRAKVVEATAVQVFTPPEAPLELKCGRRGKSACHRECRVVVCSDSWWLQFGAGG